MSPKQIDPFSRGIRGKTHAPWPSAGALTDGQLDGRIRTESGQQI